MAAFDPKTYDFFSQGDSQKALELKRAFEEVMANIETIRAWGAALATKLNADVGVTDTNYTGPTL